MNWTPEPSHIQWAKNLVSIMRDRGKWTWPDANATLMFDKVNKVIYVTEAPENFKGSEDDFRNQKVFEAIGWTVKHLRKDPINPVTIRGCPSPDNVIEERCVSFGRTWFGSSKDIVSEGMHRVGERNEWFTLEY